MDDKRFVHGSAQLQQVQQDLLTCREQTKMFILLAKDTINRVPEQHRHLQTRIDATHNGMIAFVEELHEQLIACITNFVGQIQTFKTAQTTKLDSLCEDMHAKIASAEHLVAQIDYLLQQSDLSMAPALARQCHDFLKSCGHVNRLKGDFAYFDFVPAGRLIVRPEHLGYLRSCDAIPAEVDLVAMTREPAMCYREYKILIRTNRSQCIDAKECFEARLMLGDGTDVPVEVRSNNDGSYQAVFTPESDGIHTLHVKLFGIGVNGSPMVIDVLPPTSGDAILGQMAHNATTALLDLTSEKLQAIEITADAAAASVQLEQEKEFRPTAGMGRGRLRKLESPKSPVHSIGLGTGGEDFDKGMRDQFSYLSQSITNTLAPLRESKQANADALNGGQTDGAVKQCKEFDMAAGDHWSRKAETSVKKTPSLTSGWNECLPSTMKLGEPQVIYEPPLPSNEWDTLPHETKSFGNHNPSIEQAEEVVPSREWMCPPPHEVKTSVSHQTTIQQSQEVNADIPGKVARKSARKSSSGFGHASETFGSSRFPDLSHEPMESFSPPPPLERPSASIVRQPTAVTSTGILHQYLLMGVKKVKTEFLRQIGRPGDGDDCLFLPIGVAANRLGEIIVCDTRHNALKIFNAMGGLKLCIQAKRDQAFLRPSAVVTNVDGDIFVKDDHCIHVFSADGKFLRAIGAGQLSRPYGLTMNRNGDLMLIDISKMWPPTLCTFSQNGDLVSRVPYLPLAGCAQLIAAKSKCRFVECLGDALFVVDLGRSVVYKTDLDGNPLSEFGAAGRQLGEFNEPSGITKDGDDILLIADSRNNRIQMFTPDGTVHGFVDLAQDIVRPSDIFLAPDGLLYVSNYLRHCIKVFRVLPP